MPDPKKCNIPLGSSLTLYRLEHGDPPLDLPFEYSDARTQKFLNGDSWFKRGKIKLPSCFEYDSTYGGNLVSRVALSEGLAKRALKSAHGILT